jgi:pyruvate formate lyase activating enzyme
MKKTGRVVNIQRFSIHDGPGIRSEIFFKGCPLRCKWCSNPESISPKPELGIYPSKCIGLDKCSLCVKACPQERSPLVFIAGRGESFSNPGSEKTARAGPIHGVDQIVVSAERDLCLDGCMACADACPSSALIKWGKEMTVDDLLKIIVADRSLYLKSGGGVTLSGGEVMLQWEFARDLLRACKKSYIHTCVESALYCGREQLKSVFEFSDLVITDIKHMDDQSHMLYTGVGNKLILENIMLTVEMGKKLLIRIPVIPGHNDDDGNILATGAFIRDVLGNRVVQVQLLPYRKLGTEKYDSLNLSYPLGDDYIPPERAVWEANILRLTRLLTDMGVPAVAGSNVKYTV